MGLQMEIADAGRVVSDYGRDSRAFGHFIENLRDSLLNGAKRVEFGIHGLKHDDAGNFLPEPFVLRRTIADDGDGMDNKILREIYSKFSLSGTKRDFDIEVNPDCSTKVSLIEIDNKDEYHARRGFGGRGTLYRFNKMGVVTVTIRDGVANLVWMYADIDGNPQMREFYEYDEHGINRKRAIIAPYTEPDVLTKSDLMVDKDYAIQLLIRTDMVMSEGDAIEYLASMSDEDSIPNPYAGMEWDGNIIPEWIVASWESGVALRADGSKAHGTVKVLLGDHITHSTAVTGDPFYDGEREHGKVNGMGNHFWIDLSHWDVRIWAVRPIRGGEPEKASAEGSRFKIADSKEDYELDYKTGRKQDGAIPRRTRVTTTETREGVEDPLSWREVVDLGEYGSAVILYARDLGMRTDKDGKEHQRKYTSFWGSGRDGIVGMAYGLELHGLFGDSLEVGDTVYRAMGFPISGKTQANRLSVVFVPPRAHIKDGVVLRSGIHQTSARDRIKWNGEDLPLYGKDGMFKAIADNMSKGLKDLIRKESYDASDEAATHVSVEKMTKLFSTARGMIKAMERRASEAASEEKKRALLGDGGSEKGTVAGVQGKPGATERTPCPECGLKIHADACSLKPKRGSGSGGGTNGDIDKLEPGDKGKRRGRVSRARVKAVEEPKEVEVEVEGDIETPPNPPTIVITDDSPGSDPRFIAAYNKADAMLPDTGTVFVNSDHAYYKMLIAIAEETRRDKAQVRSATDTWVRTQVAGALLGMLMVRDTTLAKDAGAVDIEDLASYVVANPALWDGVFGSMIQHRESLISYVKSHAAVVGEKAA